MKNPRSFVFAVLSALVAATVLAPIAEAGPKAVIVVLKDGASVGGAVKRHGAAPSHEFGSALRGYAAVLSDAQRQKAAADPAVDFLAPDRPVALLKASGGGVPTQPAQSIPTGISYIGGLLSPTAVINGIDTGVNVDVAVIDTGIDPTHPDLNFYRGRNCSSGTSPADGNGHGSHVAGTIGALDNTKGVVGVAPGARLWAARVLNNAGSGSTASVVCGIDWVTANAAEIEVANMSLGSAGSDDGNCGRTNGDAMHLAVCNSVAAGITYAVAAGNSSADANYSAPAAYREVTTVSAIADFNGVQGGTAAAPTCRTDVDDTFADFSNFGSAVDIAAPGVCIKSTWKGGGYNTISGTSMASPHVAGAAALYLATHPGSTPAQVGSALIAAGSLGPVAGDPDAFPERILNVSAF